MDVEPRRAALLDLAGTAPREAIYAALLEIDRGVRTVARFIVKSGTAALDAAAVERQRLGRAELRANLGGFLSEVDAAQAAERAAALVRDGVPEALARDVAMLPLVDRALNVLRLCDRVGVPPVEAARVYTRIGEGAGIHAVYRRLREAEAAGVWDRMVLVDLRWDLLDLQRRVTESVLAAKPADPIAAANELLDRNEPLLESVQALDRQITPADGASALMVLASRLRGLAAD